MTIIFESMEPGGFDAPRPRANLDVEKIIPNLPRTISDYLGEPYPIRVQLSRPMTFHERKRAASLRPDWLIDPEDNTVLVLIGSLEDLLGEGIGALTRDVRWIQAEGRQLDLDEVDEVKRQGLLVERLNAKIAADKKRP